MSSNLTVDTFSTLTGDHSSVKNVWENTKRLYSEVGLDLIGTFEEGCTVTNTSQVVLFAETGKGYSWSGALNKTVPKPSTPETTGGIGAGAWVDRTQDTLAINLTSVLKVDSDSAFWLRDFVSIREFGVVFDGVTDSTDAIKSAFSSGLKIHIPDPGDGNYAIISDTVLIDNNTVIWSENPNRVVIKCSPLMSPSLHSICTKNYYNSTNVANKNIGIFGLNIDSNGYNRGESSSGFGLVINAENAVLDKVTVSNSPEWNFFFTSGNPFAAVGHNGQATAYSKNIRATRLVSNDPIGGDGLIIQGTIDSVFTDYTNNISATLAPSKVLKDAGFQVIEGCHNLEINDLKFYHNGAINSGLIVSSHDQREFISNIKVDGVYGNKLSKLFATWSDTTTQAINVDAWLTRGCYAKNLHLDYPVLDTSSTTMQSRLVDIQNMIDVKVEHVSATLMQLDGTHSAPTTSINFDGAYDVSVDGIKINRIPNVGTTTYSVTKSKGWINVSGASGDIQVSDIKIENFGYFNRIVSDTSIGAINKIDGISVGAAVSDGGTKEVIVSCATDLELTRADSVPSGATLGRFSSTFTSETGTNLDVKQTLPKKLIGGLRIRSISSGGVQAQAGILFDRQFVGSSDPLGSLGKGSVAFRTSDATPGTFSITAYHEDLGQHRPIVYARSTTSPAKAFSPVIDNDTYCGEAATRWKEIFAANGAINTSDEREKTFLDIVEAEKTAATQIKSIIKKFQWNKSIAEKGVDGARYHFGVGAQTVKQILIDNGLNPDKYGFLCYDEWDDAYQDVYNAVEQEDGSIIYTKTGDRVLIRESGSRYGIRYDELLCFIISAL